MHRSCRLLEYVNYMVYCLGLFASKNRNEIYFLKKVLLVMEKRPDMNSLPEIREIRQESTRVVKNTLQLFSPCFMLVMIISFCSRKR